LFSLRDIFLRYIVFLFWGAIILSFWVNGWLGPIYEYLVFQSPIAGKIGFIFRDPNKLVGIVAFCESILLSVWLIYITSKLSERIETAKKWWHFIKKQHSFKHIEYLLWKEKHIEKILLLFLASIYYIVCIWLCLYVLPFYHQYIAFFYKPVPIPSEYTRLFSSQKEESPSTHYLYIPRYERLSSPGYDFATTTWNLGKPASAVDLYSSNNPTLHPLEWATNYLWLFYDYLDSYLKNSTGKNMAKYLAMMSIDRLVYHDDIIQEIPVQQKALENVYKQKHLSSLWKDGFMNVFNVSHPLPSAVWFLHNMYHFSGLRQFETLLNIQSFQEQKFSHIFVDEDTHNAVWSKIEKKGDIISTQNKYDLFLSMIPQKYSVFPFDHNNSADPFHGWAKVKLNIPDWNWYMKFLHIDNWSWQFDGDTWVIFTLAPRMLGIKPYEHIAEKWAEIMNLKNVTTIPDFFTPSDEANIKISLDTTNSYSYIPALVGTIPKWTTKVWSVGEMKTLKVQEKTAYYFEMVVSWDGVEHIHGKVKFLDIHNKELSVAYVSAPKYVETFSLVKFSGDFITPPWTTSIRFQIGSQRKADRETHWWLHDLKVKDLWAYTLPNIQTVPYTFKDTGKYSVFVRSFQNTLGGKMVLHIRDTNFPLLTKSKSTNSFEWKKIGQIEIQKPTTENIDIEALSGFNAINSVVIVPEYILQDFEKRLWNNNLFQSSQIIPLEAETDFDIDGNIQSPLPDIEYSNGKSINMFRWTLTKKIDILKSGTYDITTRLNTYSHIPAKFIVDITGENTFTYHQEFSSPKDQIQIPNIALSRGTYTLSIEIQDQEWSLVNAQDLKRDTSPVLDPSSIHQPEDEKWCSYFIWLFNSSIGYAFDRGKRYFTLQRGHSCFWFITSHDPVKVDTGKEYLVSFNIEKKNTRLFHAKIKYLDAHAQPLTSVYFDNFDANYQDDTPTKIEQIITPPPWAHYMKLQFWQKQVQVFHKYSQVGISDLIIKAYKRLPWVDSVLIFDHRVKDMFTPDTSSPVSITEVSGNTLKKNIEITPQKPHTPIILQFAQTFSPFWALFDGAQKIAPLISNIALTGYPVDVSWGNTYRFEFLLRKQMWVGYSVSFFVFLMVVITWIRLSYFKKKKTKKTLWK
jgi:hypothetical protein